MKVLVIGAGGREHAIVRGLLLSARKPEVFCAPGNGGTDLPVAERRANNVDIAASDLDALVAFARDERIDLTIVGPEDPLASGVVDRFRAAGLRIFGPTAAAARLEWDKAFAKRTMQSVGVPTADARIFEPTDAERRARSQRSDPHDARLFRLFEKAQEYFIRHDRPVFVRAAGSDDPRGFFDCRDAQEAIRAAEQLMMQRILGAAGEAIRVDEHPLRGFDLAREYILTREDPLVVKASGLARGKGVFVCNDPAGAIDVARRLMLDRALGDAGESIVVEERLAGREVSVLALVDGRTIYLLEAAQDHKRLLDGDAGPNTGGMGAFSARGLLSDDVLDFIQRSIFVPVIDAMVREETPYTGVLYAGLMLTPGGPKVLEFNCRFGDPEAQPILLRLRSDLLEVIEAAVDGRLDQVTLDWDPRPAVCVVMASEGYPDSVQPGHAIAGLGNPLDPVDPPQEHSPAQRDAFIFHAGTRRREGHFFTSGGRVLGVTALGDTIALASQRAYAAIAGITFEGAAYRRDIARSAEAGKFDSANQVSSAEVTS